MTELLSERMSGGSFSPTNDGVLTCDECGREPNDPVRYCSSHEDLQHKKEVAALEVKARWHEELVAWLKFAHKETHTDYMKRIMAVHQRHLSE